MTKTSIVIHPFIQGFNYEWQEFKDRLDPDLQQDFDNMIKQVNRPLPPDPDGILFQRIIMSILIEHEKEINRLSSKIVASDNSNQYF